MQELEEKLIIDGEFEALMRPLTKEEFRHLERCIRNDGCRTPIIVWNSRILEGQNQYRICEHWHIPYKIVRVNFPGREDAISWICANQLDTNNISDEMRKYLIGKRFIAEKIINQEKRKKKVQKGSIEIASLTDDELFQLYKSGDDENVYERNRTADQIAKEYHISHSTVEKYARFSRAIDAISDVSPRLAPRILSGECKIAHMTLIELSRLREPEMQTITSALYTARANPSLRYCDTRERIQEAKPMNQKITIQPGIKNMPKPNPDAVLTSLILTVPSWEESIRRALYQSDMPTVSLMVKEKLETALNDLKNTVDKAIEVIKE